MRTIYEINKELEKSNEQLKQDILYWQRKSQRLEKRNKEIYEGIITTTQELCDTTKELEDYKSRCEKAIEYLLNNKLYTFKYDDEELFEITTDKKAKDELLKILGGEK